MTFRSESTPTNLTSRCASFIGKYDCLIGYLHHADTPRMLEDPAHQDVARWGKDGELNGALLYFASDASSYTTGQILAVDGGWLAE